MVNINSINDTTDSLVTYYKEVYAGSGIPSETALKLIEISGRIISGEEQARLAALGEALKSPAVIRDPELVRAILKQLGVPL